MEMGKIKKGVVIVVHLLMWFFFFYMFVRNNFSKIGFSYNPHKEWALGCALMILCYLNYFFITPRFYLAGYIRKFWMVLLSVLIVFTACEYLLFMPELKLFKPIYYPYYERYVVQKYLLSFIRNSAVVIFFTFLKSNHYFVHQYQTERKVLMTQASVYNIIVSGKEVKPVNINDIVFIQHQKNYTYFHLADGSIYSQYISLLKVEEELPEALFMRISRSALINANIPIRLEHDVLKVEMPGFETISLAISPKYREGILQNRENLCNFAPSIEK